MSNLKLSIIIPAFNEEKIADKLLTDIDKAFSDVEDYEIIMIDDGSNLSLIEHIDEKLLIDNVRVIRNKFNIGQTPSIKLGIEHSNGEVIALMDGDGQNPPEEVRKLFNIFSEKNLDAVISYREKRKDSLYKKFISKSGNFILKFFTKSRFRDLGSSIKIIKKSCFEDIKFDGELHRFLVPMLEKRNYLIEEFPTRHEFRREGKTNYGINRLIPVFVDGLLFYLSDGFTKTKRYALGKIAFLTLFISAIINFVVLYQKITNDIFVHRNPLFIIGITSMLISIFIFSIGISIDET